MFSGDGGAILSCYSQHGLASNNYTELFPKAAAMMMKCIIFNRSDQRDGQWRA